MAGSVVNTRPTPVGNKPRRTHVRFVKLLATNKGVFMAVSSIAFHAPIYIQGTPFYLSDIESFCVEDNTFLLTDKNNETHEFTISSDLEKAQIIQLMTIFMQHL